MQCIPQPDPDVVATAMPDGDTVLLQLRTRQYFSLNATGSLLWKLMESSADLEAMSQALSNRFDITPPAARDTVVELVQTLKTHQLITASRMEE